MSGLGYVFIAAGLLFGLRPTAAARYSGRSARGERLVRFAVAPALVILGVVIALGITIR